MQLRRATLIQMQNTLSITSYKTKPFCFIFLFDFLIQLRYDVNYSRCNVFDTFI